MNRSKEGLHAAGKWHILKDMLPEFKNTSVLDLGCGYGWHSLYTNQHGASSIIGIDISQKMLDVAIEKAKLFDNIEYVKSAMEDLFFKEKQFDTIISSLAFHYIEDFNALVKNIAYWIKDGGDFVFSVEHPIFTSREEQDWIYDEEAQPKYWAVDRYHEEGIRHTHFLGEEVVKYQRTISTYLSVLLCNGFTITGVDESYPSKELLEKVPESRQELKRPMFLLISAQKDKKNRWFSFS